MSKTTIPNHTDITKKVKYTGIYKTHALADAKSVDPANNVSKPSDTNVAEARTWVNYNEK